MREEGIRSHVKTFIKQSLCTSHGLLIPLLSQNKTLVEITGIFNLPQHPDLAKDRGAFTSISNQMEKTVYLNHRNTTSTGTH